MFVKDTGDAVSAPAVAHEADREILELILLFHKSYNVIKVDDALRQAFYGIAFALVVSCRIISKYEVVVLCNGIKNIHVSVMSDATDSVLEDDDALDVFLVLKVVVVTYQGLAVI